MICPECGEYPQHQPDCRRHYVLSLLLLEWLRKTGRLSWEELHKEWSTSESRVVVTWPKAHA